MKKAIELLDRMIEENYEAMENLFIEFVDEVENDEHILYELRQLRHIRKQLSELQVIIEEQESA